MGDDDARRGDDAGALVSVAVHPTRVDASLTQGLLAQGGIESEIVGNELLGGIYGTAVSVDGFRVCVRGADVAAAEELLAAARESPAGMADDDDRDPSAARGDAADGAMRRAMAAAVFGLFIFPPLALYAVSLMATASHGGLSARGRKHRLVAIVFAAGTIVTWSLVGLSLARP